MASQRSLIGAAAALLALLSSASIAAAQSPADFFKNREVRIIVGADPGGGYDTYARILARFLSNHLPGKSTNFVVQNMPGAGSIVAMSHLYNVAAKDGTVMGAINPGAVAEPLLNPDSAKYDPRKMHWIGSIMRDTEVILSWHTTPFDTLQKVFEQEILVGSTGGSSAASTLPRLINGLLGSKFKLIEGYKGANEIVLAMERGEVQGYGSSSWSGIRNSQQKLFDEKKLRVIGQYGLSPHPDLTSVPIVMGYAQTDDQKAALRLMLTRQELGRPFVLPPGAPDAILNAYRQGFDAMVKDMAFVDELKNRKLDLQPMTGAEVHKMIAGIFAAPPAVVDNVKRILTAR